MLHNTEGIVLRSVKYGETSLILTVFTELTGLQSYMIKGVRSEKSRSKRSGLLQVASLLNFVAEHKPNRQLQHIREFQPSYIYQHIQEEIVKNSIAIFSVELLSRLLPHDETMENLYHFVHDYFINLDQSALNDVGNFPLFFTIQCGKQFGYNILGNYSADTPFLSETEGFFTDQPPASGSILYPGDISALAQMISVSEIKNLTSVSMNAAMRNRLLDWYIQFLKHHTQHLGHLRSLQILRTILH